MKSSLPSWSGPRSWSRPGMPAALNIKTSPRLVGGGFRLDAEGGRFPRGGRDHERLQEKRADGQGHDRRDHEDLHVLAPAVPGRRRKELVADLHRLLVQPFQALGVARLEQRGIARLQGFEGFEITRRKNVLREDSVALQASVNEFGLG